MIKQKKQVVSGIQLFSLVLIISIFLNPLHSKSLEFNSSKKLTTGLEVSKDGHSLLKDGKPFFWMGDTGWMLLKESPENIDFYFKNRVKNQFNVIQLMVTRRMFNDKDFQANYRGDLPFESLNPVRLNERYFAHLDTVVKIAEKYNLILAMVPTWGWNLDQIFFKDKPEEAYRWGQMLGKRYEKYRNIVWAVCGEYQLIAWDTVKNKPDSNPDSLELNLIDNLARGIKNGSQGNALMTIHPDSYKSSSEYLHNADWLDFNMVQSFSLREDTEFDVIDDYMRMPYKPTVLAEPGYEDGWAKHKAFELRYEGYHAILNGACGFTFGCDSIWTFRGNWKKSLDSEGALQMKYLRKLFESRPMLHRVPAPVLIKDCTGDWVKKTRLVAAREDSGAYAFIYFPGDTIKVEVNVGEGISGAKANAWWYNPRDGETYDANGAKVQVPFGQYPCGKSQKDVFDPPGNKGYGHDWVLILDDSDRKFEKP